MNFKLKNYYIVSIFLVAIANCPRSKAEGTDDVIKKRDPNLAAYELIQLINPDRPDPEMDKLIQVDILKSESPYFREEWIQALRAYHRELIARQEIKDYQAQGDIYKKIAYAYSALGIETRVVENYEYAIQAYNQSGHLTEDLSVPTLFYYELGDRYISSGELEKAERYLQYAHQKYQEEFPIESKYNRNRITRELNLDEILCSLGRVYRLNGQKNKAINFYQQAEEADRCKSRKNSLTIGEIYLELGQHKKAINYFDSLVVSSGENGYDRYLAKKIYNYLAQAYMLYGDLDRAIDRYNVALEIDDEDNIDRADSYFGLGETYTHLGNNNQAISYWLKALYIYRQTNDDRNIIKIQDTLRRIANTYDRSGKSYRAIAYYEQSLNLAFEVRHLLLESYPEEFYLENDASLNKLLLLLEKTNRVDKYSQWQKLEKSFKFDRYLKTKLVDDFLTNTEEKEIVGQWKSNIRLLKYAHQDIPSNVYEPDCKIKKAKYQQIKRELNKLSTEINKNHHKIAKFLQIENQHLTINEINKTCKKRNPTDSIIDPNIFIPYNQFF